MALHFFDPFREETDACLCKVPQKYLPAMVKCGIAPAMHLSGKGTYWGQEVDEEDVSIIEHLWSPHGHVCARACR